MGKLFNLMLISCFLFSLSLYAKDDNKELTNNFDKELFESKIKELDSEKILKDIDLIFKGINENKSYNEYKKYLLREKVLFVYKLMYMSDNEEFFNTEILPDFFKLTVCLSFNFEANTDFVVNNLIESILSKNESKIEDFMKVSNYLYSEEVLSSVQKYIRSLGDNIVKTCTTPLE